MCRNSKRKKTLGDVPNGQDCNKRHITLANNRKATCVNCLRDGERKVILLKVTQKKHRHIKSDVYQQ